MSVRNATHKARAVSAAARDLYSSIQDDERLKKVADLLRQVADAVDDLAKVVDDLESRSGRQ
jgi:hypothetical protein